VEVSTTWELSIDMASIEEGRIVFCPKENNDEDVIVAYNQEGDMKMDRSTKDLADGIANSVKQNMTAAVESVSDTLSQAMADTNRLCLPATSTFSQKTLFSTRTVICWSNWNIIGVFPLVSDLTYHGNLTV
jgi:hypothetical protein